MTHGVARYKVQSTDCKTTIKQKNSGKNLSRKEQKIMKFNDTLMKMVDKDIERGLIPMLLGEPGIGKSSWVIALGKRNCTQVFVLPCNQLADKADLTGARLVPITDDNGAIVDYDQVFYPHSVINRAIRYAEEHPRENPILFMDELNRTTPDVTSECLSIPTLRAIGNKKLPANLRVITAGNDKGNITSLDEASISRFVLSACEDFAKSQSDTMTDDTKKDMESVIEDFTKNFLENNIES